MAFVVTISYWNILHNGITLYYGVCFYLVHLNNPVTPLYFLHNHRISLHPYDNTVTDKHRVRAQESVCIVGVAGVVLRYSHVLGLA